jgi:hypothetical protein
MTSTILHGTTILNVFCIVHGYPGTSVEAGQFVSWGETLLARQAQLVAMVSLSLSPLTYKNLTF